MKFGAILYNATNNIGDDIQTFAAMRHLPRVDCLLDRESLNDFRPADGMPVAVPMCGWYMHRKWNWPPSRFIVPLPTSMHYETKRIGRWPKCPATTEFLSGCGADWLKAWGPVGCRDLATLEALRELGIEAFFSGCVTLTLPRMERRESSGGYICACDLPENVLAKLRQTVAGRCEIVETTHRIPAPARNRPWEERERRVVELLTLYQNAKCVVTKRLHCALPCLAMGVPVFLTNKGERPSAGRYDPYYGWIRNCTWKQFLAGDFAGYDFLSPPPNGTRHLPVREAMAASIAAFVEKWKDEDGPPERYVRTGFSDEEFVRWRLDVMRRCMDVWQDESEGLQWDWEDRLRSVRAMAASLEESEREAKHWRRLFSSPTVRWAIRLRNLLLPKRKRLLSYAEAKAARARCLEKKQKAPPPASSPRGKETPPKPDPETWTRP